MKKLNVSKAMKGITLPECLVLVGCVAIIVLIVLGVNNVTTYHTACNNVGGVAVKSYNVGYVCIPTSITIEVAQ